MCFLSCVLFVSTIHPLKCDSFQRLVHFLWNNFFITSNELICTRFNKNETKRTFDTYWGVCSAENTVNSRIVTIIESGSTYYCFTPKCSCFSGLWVFLYDFGANYPLLFLICLQCLSFDFWFSTWSFKKRT